MSCHQSVYPEHICAFKGDAESLWGDKDFTVGKTQDTSELCLVTGVL